MKKNLVKMAAMAAVVMFAQAAGAQSFTGRMKAEVPFAFQAGKANLGPGTYDVTMSLSSTGATIMKISGAERSIAVVSPSTNRKNVKDESAALVFSCAGESCMLKTVRAHNVEYGTGARPKLSAAERERLYTVRMSPATGRTAE